MTSEPVTHAGDEPVRTFTFGRSALATPANAVTMARLGVSPFLLAAIAAGGAGWVVTFFWIVLCVTDGIDGWLARKQGTTSSGAFLDPLADKVLVLGGFGALVVRGDVWWVPVALIASREMAVSVFRYNLARRGISVPARYWAKVKTVVSELAIGFAILPLTAHAHWWYSTLVWAAVALTLVTGAQYLLEGGKTVRAS